MEQTYNITVNEAQLRDIKIILERCDLKGAEVPKFVALAQAVMQAKLVETPTSETNLQKVD